VAVEEVSNKNYGRKFFKEAQFSISKNRCYQYPVKTKVVTYCQSMGTFYEGGDNTSVTYKSSVPELCS